MENDIFKDSLLATVSHDFRNPLSAVMGLLETSLELSEINAIKKQMKKSLRLFKLLEMLVNDLMDYVQFANKKLKMNLENCEIDPILDEIKNLMNIQAKKKKIVFLIENYWTGEVFTDPNRLKQVLVNLIGNAIKFTSKGHVKLICKPQTSQLLEISVEDTGIGIKEAKIHTLFEQFGKLDQEDTTLNKRGVGLGLYISQEIAKQLNPTGNISGIRVISEYGKGSTFSFSIPAAKR